MLESMILVGEKAYDHKMSSKVFQHLLKQSIQSADDAQWFADTILPQMEIYTMVNHPTGIFVVLVLIEAMRTHLGTASQVWQAMVDSAHMENEQVVWALCTCSSGQRVLQSFLPESSSSLVADPIFVYLFPHLTELAAHAFGNYAVQHVMKVAPPHVLHAIVCMWNGRLATMACHKFSSVVLETLMRLAPTWTTMSMIHELIVDAHVIMHDRYGNFVLQTAADLFTTILGSATGGPDVAQQLCSSRDLFVRQIESQMSQLRGTVFLKWSGIRMALLMSKDVPPPAVVVVDEDTFDPVKEIQMLLHHSTESPHSL